MALIRHFTPAALFLGGVAYDAITLTRIDRLSDNLILLAYLLLLGALIVLVGQSAVGQSPISPSTRPLLASWLSRLQPYYPMGIQFLLGSLFSAYAIFYSWSASLSTTAIFFAILIILLVANEFLHGRLTNLRLLIGLYALVGLSFFAFFLPVMTKVISRTIFLISAGLSLMLVAGVLLLIYRKAPQRSVREIATTGLPAVGLVGLIILFYFLNWIPPVPLSLKFSGVYHQIAKQDDVYHLAFEEGAWYQFGKRSDDVFHGQGPAYCFTAVFAPTALRTKIYHRWQYRPAGASGLQGFRTTDRISFTLSGGRDKGYRGATMKRSLSPGEWRVDVETEDGQLLGRVRFRVEETAGAAKPLKNIYY